MSSFKNQLHRRCSGSIPRRCFLEFGSASVGGLGIADLLRLRAEAHPTGASEPDTSVILVWLHGGPSQLETYDMKPDATTECRGEFKPIPTNVPGIDVCELLPLHANVADRFTLIRSISHDFSDHGGGGKRFLTGRLPKAPFGFVNDAPCIPSIVAKVREQINRGVPNCIAASDEGRDLVSGFPFGSAYLGPSYNSFSVLGDPSDPKFSVRNLAMPNEMLARLDDRRSLLEGLDQFRRDVDRSGAMAAMDKYNQKAFELLTSPSARRAFDLSLEDPKLRERYGDHSWGQRALLARRLVEAGSSFVTVLMENARRGIVELPAGVDGSWDLHAVNGHIFNDARFRLPPYDQAISALIEDIYSRGLDKKVMLVVAGEFGRTPFLEHAIGTTTGVMQPGRGHWPAAQSVLVAGAGMRTGQVVGSTDRGAAHPQDRPLTPNDLWATVYRHLGIDYTKAFLDHSGRPMPILPFGEPIRELL